MDSTLQIGFLTEVSEAGQEQRKKAASGEQLVQNMLSYLLLGIRLLYIIE